MAQIVVLVRHGKAQTRSLDAVDFERTLTEAGRRALVAWLPKSARLLADELAALGCPDVEIWTSPADRARQTADLVAEALLEQSQVKSVDMIEEPCLWEQDCDTFLALARESVAPCVVAVGHNPFCEAASQQICGEPIPFATGGIACFKLEGEGSLLWFVQGPESKRWKAACDIEKTVRKAANAIDERLERFLESPEDAEAAHKVRVSIRTMRGLLAFLKPFQTSAQNKQMNSDLRANVLCTSRLRELDVLCDQVAQLEPAADDLLEACRQQRALECERTIKALTSKDARKRFNRIAKSARQFEWKRPIVELGMEPDAVRNRFEEVTTQVETDLESLDLADAERTHDVRKQAKQVRYAAEQFGGFIGEEAVETATRMEAAQDRLGALCDARVNVELVDSFPREGLSEHALWDLGLLRAQNEAFILNTLREASR